MVAKGARIAISLDGFGKDDLVELVRGDARLSMRSSDLENLTSELFRSQTTKAKACISWVQTMHKKGSVEI